MDDLKEKLPVYRTMAYTLAAIIALELIFLAAMTPAKTTFFWIMLAAIAISLLYLIVLCLKLVKELQKRS